MYQENMMLDHLKLNHILFTNGFGEKLPFKDEQFDLIICHTVIEHVKDVELVLTIKIIEAMQKEFYQRIIFYLI